jgi:hypothetical protein
MNADAVFVVQDNGSMTLVATAKVESDDIDFTVLILMLALTGCE